MMRDRVGAVVLAIAALQGGAVASAAEDRDLYDRGRTAVFDEQWSEAGSVLDELIRRFPDSPFADDAHYWRGMALYEDGQAERAYGVLKQMGSRYPSSPWSDDARALMVRCALAAMRSSPDHGGSMVTAARATEYEAFLERSTRDSNARVQLLAIDTVLRARPGRAVDLLPRLSSGGAPREAAGLVMDRFFGGERVKVTMADPALGLQEGNVTVMVRDGGRALQLGLEQALRSLGDPGAAGLDESLLSEIQEKLLRLEKQLVREGGPGSLEAPAVPGSDRASAIVKVVDGEMHYYRNGQEAVKILVLKREAGFDPDNVKIFLETRAGQRAVGLAEARELSPGGRQAGLSEASVRYLKAALAIIEIDLTRSAGAK